jgi:hypothetical protein
MEVSWTQSKEVKMKIEENNIWCLELLPVPKCNAMKTYRRSRGKVPHILDLGTGWR